MADRAKKAVAQSVKGGLRRWARRLVLVAAGVSGVATESRLHDFDGDGKDDVLLRHGDGSWEYYAAPELGRERRSQRVGMTRKAEWHWAVGGDFDGDGRDDAMLRRNDGVWVYYPLNGAHVIAAGRGWANLTRKLDWRVVGVGDLNGDRRDDVLMRRNDGPWVYYPMNGRRVIAGERGWANLPRSLDWRSAGIGDFDSDGADGVLLRHVDGTWRHYPMAGHRVAEEGWSAPRLSDDVSWRVAAVGDFMGDGRDAVLLRHASGRWRHESLTGGEGISQRPMPGLPRAWAWRLAGVGDLNGDGTDDVLLRNAGESWRAYHVVGGRTAGQLEPGLPRDSDWRMAARPVHMPDASLRAAVEEVLEKPQGAAITRRELSGLETLVAKSAGVEELTGIEWATGLRTLRVDDNAIRDIGPLAGLIELKTLEVDRNEVSDVSALAQLTALEELQLYDNRIEDVGPLEGLHRLRLLYIFANRIEDVAPLAGLEQLHLLRLDQNYLRDISPLAGLRALSSLSLGSNEISDISPLAGMTRMYWLWLNDTRIRDITPLSGLRGVVELNLERNGIEDIGALAGMTDMKVLHLRENRIADVSALAGMRKLEFLRLDSNAVVDVSPLAELTALRELSAQRNGIRDIAALARLTRLEVLALSHNAIKDLSALSGLTGLVELWLEENRVVDLSPLAGLRELEFLDLGSNAVVDVAPLENLTNLDYLDLSHNRIADLKPLAANDGLGKGDRIDVRGNPLTDESVETVLPALAARGADVASGGVSEFEAVHDDNVVVLRVGDAIAKETLSTGLALEAYAREFYRHFEDRFDFLMFFSNLDDISDHENAPYYGVYSSVRNDVEGTGRTRYYTNRYGSTERLKGVIHFPYNRALLFGPSLHEVQHAWANYAVPTAVGGHWGFSSANGQLGGFDIADLADLGDGRYAGGPFGTFANGGNGPAYSPIELYLAGFIAPEEVPDLWVAESGEWVYEDGDIARTAEGDAIFAADSVKTYTIDDIVAAHGPRVPAMGDAQWDFRTAVILLTDGDHLATAEQLDMLSAHAKSFSLRGSDGYGWLHNYYEATGGRGSMTMDGLSSARKSTPSAPRELPASFGAVPLPHASMIDGKCEPVYVGAVGRESAADGGDRGFVGELDDEAYSPARSP